MRLPALVAAACLCAASARGAVVADFDGDGVLDRVLVPKPPATGIIVSISGSPLLQTLKLADPPLSIVAADFDRDGDLDISAVSQRHRLYVWLNHGRGLFKRLRARFHHIGLQAPHSELRPTGRRREAGPPEQTNLWLVLAVEQARAKILRPSGAHIPPRAQPATVSDSFGSSAPRAPPSFASV